MRALLLLDSLEIGGAERSLLEIAQRFRRFEPAVCSLASGGALADDYRRAGIPVTELGLAGRFPCRAAARRLVELLADEPADLVHSTLYTAGVSARLARGRARFPLLHTWVNEPPARRHMENRQGLWKKRLAQALDRATCPRVDRFIANSQAIAEANCRALGVDPRKVTVIYRGRDPQVYARTLGEAERESLRHDLGLATGDRVVLHVGRLRAFKRQAFLLDAWPSVLAAEPRAVLLVAGEGPERQVLEERLRRLGLGERARLLGARGDVPQLLALAEAFVLPSRNEGHPGALVEAMLAGLPVVASDIPVHRETLEHEVSGLLAPCNKPEDLAAALLRALRDPEDARRLGERARDEARRRFHIDDAAERHEEIYSELVEGR